MVSGAFGKAAGWDTQTLEPTRAPETRPLSAVDSCRNNDPSTHANAEPSQVLLALIGGLPRGWPDFALWPKVFARVSLVLRLRTNARRINFNRGID
jgi:hypothetical protein